METLFVKRRLIVSILASLPLLSYSKVLTKHYKNDSIFIDDMLQSLPCSTCHMLIGQFIVQEIQMSKILINKLAVIQNKLNSHRINHNKKHLSESIKILIKNDFSNFKVLKVKGLVISETEATIWALQYISSQAN